MSGPGNSIWFGKYAFQDRQYRTALECFMEAEEKEPGFDSANGIGLCLTEMDQDAGALEWFNKAYARMSEEMLACQANRAKSLAGVGREQEALDLYNGILRFRDVPFLRYSRGLVYLQAGSYEEAIADFNKVLETEPTNDLARFGRGFAYLVLGHYAQGFSDYECRLKDDLKGPDVPLWTGTEDLTGKTILVHGEMGLGDNIMFMRYVPMLLARGAKRVVVVVPESQYPIVPKLEGITYTSADHATWPKLDYWIRFMSLAYAFRTTAETVPPPVSPELYGHEVRRFNDVVKTTRPGSLKIGLCWSGNPKSKYDAWRNVPLAKLAPLFDIPGTQFYSLQKGIRESDREAFANLPIIDLDPYIKDFGDTSHAMYAMDLMITVDTSVAHMAGTVGIPTWVMLTTFRTYWLWISRLATSPWYPSVRVFRQPKDGDWDSVVETIRKNIMTKLIKAA